MLCPDEYQPDVSDGNPVPLYGAADRPSHRSCPPDLGIGGYVGISVVLLAVIGFFEYLQYNATFLSSYQESANMRIRLAERLRMLPLSFLENEIWPI